MDKNNLLQKKVPDRATNILKGLGIIVVSGLFSFVLFLGIMFMGFRGDVQGPDYSGTAWLVAGTLFLVSFVKAIRLMFRPIKK
jgi:hypothetical protein